MSGLRLSHSIYYDGSSCYAVVQETLFSGPIVTARCTHLDTTRSPSEELALSDKLDRRKRFSSCSSVTQRQQLCHPTGPNMRFFARDTIILG